MQCNNLEIIWKNDEDDYNFDQRNVFFTMITCLIRGDDTPEKNPDKYTLHAWDVSNIVICLYFFFLFLSWLSGGDCFPLSVLF